MRSGNRGSKDNTSLATKMRSGHRGSKDNTSLATKMRSGHRGSKDNTSLTFREKISSRAMKWFFSDDIKERDYGSNAIQGKQTKSEKGDYRPHP